MHQRWEKESLRTCSGVTTVVAATAVLKDPAVLGGPDRPRINMFVVSEKCQFNNKLKQQLFLMH